MNAIKENIHGFCNFKIIVCILIALAVVLRLLYISADPPVPIPPDGAFVTDQGWYNHNVLNKIQTGNWFYEEDRNTMVTTAVFSIIQYASLKIFGVHYWSAKLQPLLFSLLTIVLAFIFYCKCGNRKLGLILLFACAINYLYIAYARAALIEPTVGFFVLCSLVFWWLSVVRSKYYSVLSGVFFFVAIITKGNAAYFALFVLISFVFDLWVYSENKDRMNSIVRFIVFLMTFILLNLTWEIIWIKPHLKYLFSAKEYLNPYDVSLERVKNTAIAIMLSIYYLSLRMPIIVVLASLGLYKLATEVFDRNCVFIKENRLFVLNVLWMISCIVFFIISTKIRPRYQMLGIIPLLFVATSILFNDNIKIAFKGMRDKVVYALIALLVLLSNAYKIYSDKTGEPIGLIVLVLVIMASLYILVYFKENSLKNIKIIITIAIVYSVLQMVPYGIMLKDRSYSIVENGRKIQALLESSGEKNKYMLGPLAPTFALEGNFRSITAMKKDRFVEAVKAYKPNYALYYINNADYFRKILPAEYSNWEAVDTLRYEVVNEYKNNSVKLSRPLIVYKIKYSKN